MHSQVRKPSASKAKAAKASKATPAKTARRAVANKKKVVKKTSSQRAFRSTAPQHFSNKNVDEGTVYMTQMAQTGNYHEHPAGFLYRFTTAGQTGKGQSNNSSPKPKLSDTVEVHYEGKLINGKVFDSSYKRGQTIKFGLNQVIKGWGLAVQELSYGDKIECILPQQLAYGMRGAGADIPPGATLIFDIELFEPQLSQAAKDGQAYYAKNKASGQFHEHPAGFLFQFLSNPPAEGSPRPGNSDTVNVHYHGTNVQGKVFDSSVQRGQPTEFPLDGVVPGFSIAIGQLMTRGTKIKVIIPPELAYGDQAVSPLLPGDSTLTFEIELLDWKPKSDFRQHLF